MGILVLAHTAFGFGVMLNLSVLYLCCKKQRWKTLGNIKYLIVAQIILSTLTILANFVLVSVFEVWVPPQGSDFYCYQLPTLCVFLLSLAIFNLTALVVVKHAQITSNWKLRSPSTASILLAIASISTAVFSPVFFSIDLGWPIVQCYDCTGCSKWKTAVCESKADCKPSMNMNVVAFAFLFLVLQFIIPVVIISNRVVLVVFHLWKNKMSSETVDKQTAKSMYDFPFSEFAVNAISIVAVVLPFFFLLRNIYNADNSDKALSILNNVFHHLGIFLFAILCFPIHLKEMIDFECVQDKTKKCLIENKEKQLNFNI